jgi:hypothetical protein
MGSMSASDAAPLPRLGEVFFDVRGASRSMRLSWYADTGVAVFSIWQGGTCTGTFRLPIDDLPRMVAALQGGPHGHIEQAPAQPEAVGQPAPWAVRPVAPDPVTGYQDPEFPAGFGNDVPGRYGGPRYPPEPPAPEYPADYPEEPSTHGYHPESPARPYVAPPRPSAEEALGGDPRLRRRPDADDPPSGSFPYGPPPDELAPRQRGRYPGRH